MANSIVTAIIPLLITIVLLGVVAVVGFVAYQIAMNVAGETNKKMEKKNIAVGKGGLKVGVKERSAEQVGDSTQRYKQRSRDPDMSLTRLRVLMKTWSASGSTPNTPAGTTATNTEKRKP